MWSLASKAAIRPCRSCSDSYRACNRPWLERGHRAIPDRPSSRIRRRTRSALGRMPSLRPMEPHAARGAMGSGRSLRTAVSRRTTPGVSDGRSLAPWRSSQRPSTWVLRRSASLAWHTPLGSWIWRTIKTERDEERIIVRIADVSRKSGWATRTWCRLTRRKAGRLASSTTKDRATRRGRFWARAAQPELPASVRSKPWETTEEIRPRISVSRHGN